MKVALLNTNNYYLHKYNNSTKQKNVDTPQVLNAQQPTFKGIVDFAKNVVNEIQYRKNPEKRYEFLMQPMSYSTAGDYYDSMTYDSNALGVGNQQRVLEALIRLKDDDKVSDEFKSKVLLHDNNAGLVGRVSRYYRYGDFIDVNQEIARAILDASPNKETTKALLTTGNVLHHALIYHKDILLEYVEDKDTLMEMLCSHIGHGYTAYSWATEDCREIYLNYCDEETKELLRNNPNYRIDEN